MNKTHRHPARDRAKLASATAVLMALLAIAGCETTGFGNLSSRTGEGRAERLVRNGEYADAASVYIGIASDSVGVERDRLTLLAVEQWLNAGDIARAETSFRQVARPEAGEMLWLWNANSATIALYDGDPDTALNLLQPLSGESLPDSHRLRVEALRADAWLQKGDPGRAIEILQQRENWLNRSRDIEQSRNRLWRGLITSSPQALRSATDRATDPIVRGWLTLGSLAVATGQQGIGWSQGVVRWREMNAKHPANSVLEELHLTEYEASQVPRQIALLLPLTGNAASAGEAIQNGFLGAYYATAAVLDDRQTIRVYDVNAEGGASAAYSTAVAEGAEFVVGPLLRSSVNELANDILVPVPVLTLNYLPDDALAPPGLYQFALAPEDEAAAAAERALADGHTRALALVPSNEWGRRVFSSFATRFESLGGRVLDNRSYETGNPDFSNTIEELMALSGSVKRYQRLRANIGGPLQFDPRRRQDADLIFLAANAPAGRLLKSQLKFHYSGDIPVYSTSSIYAMDGRSNSDLNGVMFADTPWIVAPQPRIEQMPSQYAKYWPKQRRLGRLHAMGHDAYQLVASLSAARGGSIGEVDGASGRLFLDRDGRIHRLLAWAQFQGGNPVALPGPDPVGGPIPNISERNDVLPANAADAESWYEQAPDQ